MYKDNPPCVRRMVSINNMASLCEEEGTCVRMTVSLGEADSIPGEGDDMCVRKEQVSCVRKIVSL